MITNPALEIPDAFVESSIRHEHHDGVPVTVTRFQPHPAPTCGGEHVTVVTADDGTVYGYTRQICEYSSPELPTRDEAERIAFDFLRSIDPAYAAGLTVQWIEPHDETIAGADGERLIITGMKVKTRHESGLYTWVIVGAGGGVVTYERDIAWNSDHSRRETAMWLHDVWVVARDSDGAEIGGVYAPIAS